MRKMLMTSAVAFLGLAAVPATAMPLLRSRTRLRVSSSSLGAADPDGHGDPTVAAMRVRWPGPAYGFYAPTPMLLTGTRRSRSVVTRRRLRVCY